jgi:hypothetical protein
VKQAELRMHPPAGDRSGSAYRPGVPYCTEMSESVGAYASLMTGTSPSSTMPL